MSNETASIYLLNVRDVSPEQVSAYESLLSSDERQRAAGFGRWMARLRFSIGRATLRKLLSEYSDQPPADIAFHKTGKGKLLSDAGLPNFCLSHTGDWIAIALTQQADIGIDIEIDQSSQIDAALIRHAFDPAEANNLLSLPLDERSAAVYRMWTTKEAYLKAIGHGLTMPLPADAALMGWHIHPFEFGDDGIGALVLPSPAKVTVSPMMS